MEVSLCLFYIYLPICFLYLVPPRVPAPRVFLNCITAATAMSYGTAGFIERFWWGYERAKDKVISPLPNRDTAFISPSTQQTPSSFNLILRLRLFVLLFHTQHASAGTPWRKLGRGWRAHEGKDPLHRCPQSESLCSVIHPRACSAPNGFIYRVPLQQWERGKELCVYLW